MDEKVLKEKYTEIIEKAKAIGDKYIIRCNQCYWLGLEEDLIFCEELTDNGKSFSRKLSINSLKDARNQMREVQAFKGCPNCESDENIMDIPLAEYYSASGVESILMI